MKNRFGKILVDRGIYRSRLLTPYISGALSTAIISEQWLNFVDGYIIQPHIKSTIAAGPGLGIGLAPARRAGVKAGRR